MERLNLNIPSQARAELKTLAKERGRKEAELARELLLDALERARRQRFFDDVARTLTPELSDRLVTIAEALEGLRGEPR